MSRKAILCMLLLALSVTSVAAFAGNQAAFSPADINRVVDVEHAALSPDGNAVVYTATVSDVKLDRQRSSLWRVRFDGSVDRPLFRTSGSSDWDAAWSSDGRSLLFLSDRKGAHGKDVGTQVWEAPAAGGKARQVTRFPGGVDSFAVSPDGKRLAVIATDPERPPGVPAPPQPPPFVTTRYHFKSDDGGWLGSRYQHLYVVDIASGSAVLLTPGDRDQHLAAWSPDGRRIAYVSKGGPHPDRTMDYQIYVVDAARGATPRQVTHNGDNLDPYWGSVPAWSPDGKTIAFLHSLGGRWADYAPYRLAVVDVATGAFHLLAKPDRNFTHPRWSADGRTVYALLEEAEVTHLVGVDAASGNVTELDHGDRFDVDFSLSRGGRIAVVGGDDLHPYKVSALDGGRLRTIADRNGWLSNRALAATTSLQFTDGDGVRIDALLMKPIGYVAGHRYPVILRVHGGPVYQFSHEFHADWQVYAANGYAVLAVNPRGSSGRGFDFARAIYAHWGEKDGQDLQAGVDDLVRLGIADPARVGIGGWSYGAILTDQVIARNPRFKAAIAGAGSGNMYGMYGDDEYALDYELELGVPWEPENRAAWDRVSYPFLHAGAITTPTLFECDGADFNVPCEGSEQMYQALRSLDVPTEFVRYPDQHHEMTVPSYLLDRMQRDLAWYNHYLKPKQATR